MVVTVNPKGQGWRTKGDKGDGGEQGNGVYVYQALPTNLG